MSNTITVTREMLTAASDYLPNAQKEAWVSANAPKCFDRLAITADGEAMPPMYMVNEGLKRRYLMAAFAGLYLKQEAEADGENQALMSEADYDAWAGSHVFNQIERWKRDAELRDKCFDLLADFKDLEKRFTAQIVGLLNVQNDAVMRQAEYSRNAVKELPAVLEALKALQGGGESKEAEANGV